MKNEIYKPKTIKDAINCLETFLESDLYSKFRPATYIKSEKWYRQDYFKNEKAFIEYIRRHFKILEGEIKRILREKNK